MSLTSTDEALAFLLIFIAGALLPSVVKSLSFVVLFGALSSSCGEVQLMPCGIAIGAVRHSKMLHHRRLQVIQCDVSSKSSLLNCQHGFVLCRGCGQDNRNQVLFLQNNPISLGVHTELVLDLAYLFEQQ